MERDGEGALVSMEVPNVKYYERVSSDWCDEVYYKVSNDSLFWYARKDGEGWHSTPLLWKAYVDFLTADGISFDKLFKEVPPLTILVVLGLS